LQQNPVSSDRLTGLRLSSSSPNPITRPSAPRSGFYSLIAVAGLAVAVIGFAPTFFIPSLRGEFRAPSIVYVHGAFAFAWVLLFVAQTQLVRLRRLRAHRRLGYVSAGVAGGIVVTGVAVGLWATRRDLDAGQGDFARGQFVNILLELVVFGLLVLAAV